MTFWRHLIILNLEYLIALFIIDSIKTRSIFHCVFVVCAYLKKNCRIAICGKLP